MGVRPVSAYIWPSANTGCGSAMSTKQVCCHCAHLSLYLTFSEYRMRFGNVNQTSLLPLRSPFAIFGLRRIQDAVRQCQSNKFVAIALTFRYIWPSANIGCGSAMSIKQVCCHCAHLSLYLQNVRIHGERLSGITSFGRVADHVEALSSSTGRKRRRKELRAGFFPSEDGCFPR